MSELLQSVVAVILAISLAAERLVTIAKTLVPHWLGQERLDATMKVDPIRDRWRRITVLALSIASAYLATAFAGNRFGPLEAFAFTPTFSLPVFLVAILASGGSAMWNNLLGYSKAAKDIRASQSTARYGSTDRAAGSAEPLAAAADPRRAAQGAAGWKQTVSDLHALAQPALDAAGGGAMRVVPVRVAAGARTLAIQLSCPMQPRLLGGGLWRYRPDRSPDGKVATFTPGHPTLGFGSLANATNCFFRIDGCVVHENDRPPVPYEVVVTIVADGQIVYSAVPDAGGRGQVGDKNAAFVFAFQVLESA